MVIGICDDEKVTRDVTERVCREIVGKYSEELEIVTFEDGIEVLDEDLDILILDIEMEQVDGIQVKENYQRRNKDTIIIFATSHEEMMAQAFGVNVIGFVTKKYMEAQLPPMLESAIRKLMKTVTVDGVDSRNICYIKAEHVYNILHLADGSEISVRISSSELEQTLSGVGFVRVHRAYIVNLAYVDKFRDKYMIVDEDEVPISSRLKTKIKHQYELYCKENARFC